MYADWNVLFFKIFSKNTRPSTLWKSYKQGTDKETTQTDFQKMSEEKGRNKNENQTGGRTGRNYKKEYSFL